MVASVINDEDKEKIIERLHSDPLFNCETLLERIFPAKHLSVRLLVHPSVHSSIFLISVSPYSTEQHISYSVLPICNLVVLGYWFLFTFFD